MTSDVKVCVREEDAIRLIIEFLSRRELCISQLSLERESGIYNCSFGDDLIFLRQLILDGQWDDALQFVSPLECIDTFPGQSFRFTIFKHKYVELLCIRAEAGSPSQGVEVAVQDIIDCLNHLEKYCTNRDDYNRLSALLTLPNLNDDEELKNWNPNSWRLKCFRDVRPLVERFMQPSVDGSRGIATNDRLMNLIFKGLMYEACIGAIKHKLTGVPGVNSRQARIDVMNGSESTFNLNSFIQSLPENLFEAHQSSESVLPMNLDIEKHDKPELVASWSEMILSTPIKPNVFPHTSVPYTRIKAADLMSKSLSSSLMQNANAKDLMTMSVCDIAQFSRSTLAATGFHLANDQKENLPQNACDTVMTDSINRLFNSADVFSISKGLMSDNNNCDINIMPTITETITPTDSNKDEDFKSNCKANSEADSRNNPMSESYIDIWMKQNKSKLKSATDERSAKAKAATSSITPATMSTAKTNNSVNSATVRTTLATNHLATNNFNALPTPATRSVPPEKSLTSTPKPAKGSVASIRRDLNDEQFSLWNSPIPKLNPSTSNRSSFSEQHGLRSPSVSSPTPSSHSSHHTHHNQFDLSANLDANNVRFVSVAKIEDQQAIRAADFHPSGRYLAVGSNSKLLRVFQYSSQDSNNNAADSITDIPPPELIYKRQKYHKGSIYCLTWNKIGNLLATGSNDKTVKLIGFDQESRKFLTNEVELGVHDGTVRDLCFMDDLTNGSSLLLSGGAGDCKINITDCETSTTFLSLSGHSGPVLSLYTWGGAMFVSGSQDRTIRFWDLRSNSCINLITCPTITRTKPGGAVAAVCVDPTGKLLVSGHEDSTCMLYDVRGGRVIQTFHPHSADIRTIRFSSKAYYLLSGGYDNKIALTDLQGDLTQPLKSVEVASHQDKVIQCRWHPTEFTFVSTSADKSAILWALPD